MPAFLLRYLPHALIVLAVLGGVWYINDMGYDRAMRDRDAADAKILAEINTSLRTYERNAIERENERAASTKSLLDRIAENTKGGRDRIIKELTHEVRYTDPDLGIPAIVRDDINRAIAASTCIGTPDGGIRCTVPPGGTAGLD